MQLKLLFGPLRNVFRSLCLQLSPFPTFYLSISLVFLQQGLSALEFSCCIQLHISTTSVSINRLHNTFNTPFACAQVSQ